MNIGQTPWYQSGWKLALAGAGALVLVLVLVFAGFTGYYWWQIKQGKTPAFLVSTSGTFTATNASKEPKRAIDRAALETPGSAFMGLPNAPVIIVEFVDFECPNCQAAAPIMKRVMERFGYQAKLIIRHFPVESLHPGATRLSLLAWCAGQQGHFWEVHDFLFAHQDEIDGGVGDNDLVDAVAAVGLDSLQMERCLKDPLARQAVENDYMFGASIGIRGTPTFFINGSKVEGVVPFSAWENYFLSISKGK